MDNKVEWSPAALNDVDAIASYIARDSEWYASSVVNKILAITRTIPDYPHLGRKVPEADDVTIRERLVYSYRIIYQVRDEGILIVAVIHGRCLLEPVLASRQKM